MRVQTISDQCRLASRRGFTLAEVMVVVTICGFILAVATSSLLFLTKSTAGIANYQEMNMTSRFALETFASDARMTAGLNSASSTAVSLDVYDSSGNLDTIGYSYNAISGEFTRTLNGVSKVILNDVESVDLKYFTLRREVTTALLEIKEVQLQVVMRRTVLNVGNKNEILSARFMMRNRSVSS